MIKVKSFKKLKGGKKKYEITFEKNGKTYVRKFGAQGMSDFTIHKDRERRERYISRHKKDLKSGDPMKPGYLSMYILWNKPSLTASLADYKRRLGVYNRTGKFPKGIAGSKKMSFGATDPCSAEALRNLPEDIQRLIKQHCAATIIQGVGKKMDAKRSLFEALKIRGLQRYQNAAKRTKNPRENMHFINQLWTNLDPENEFTAKWFTRAAKVLTKNDFDFKTRNFWWKIVENNLTVMDEMTESGTADPREYLDEQNRTYYIDTLEALVKILNKTGYNTTLSATNSLNWPADALNWWKSKRTNFGNYDNSFGRKNTTGGSVIPSNVVNKVLYAKIKAKIKKSIKGRRWGAYDSGRLVREYKAKGGTYSGSKGKTDLSRWYKEKWVDACAWPKRKPCGRKTKSSIAYCRPSKRVDSKTPKLVQELTKAQIKARCAKKKRNPMKRVTKFGQTTPDVELGNGWVIHCNFIPGIGPHATLRRKDIAGPTRDTDHAFRYGIKYAGQAPEFWSSGPLAKGLPSPEFQDLLMNYYYEKCGGWHLAQLPPASPAPGYLQFGATQEVIDKMRQQMYNQIMSYNDVNTGIQNTITKRCKRGFQDSFCQSIFTDLLLSIYYTIVKNSNMTNNRKQNISEMEKFIPNSFKPTLLKINKSQFSKINEMLYSLQDHTYGTFKNARIASLIYEYIHNK